MYMCMYHRYLASYSWLSLSYVPLMLGNRVGWENQCMKSKLRLWYPSACWQPKLHKAVYSSFTSFFLGLCPHRALPCRLCPDKRFHTDHFCTGLLVQGIPEQRQAMPRHKSLALLTRISNGLTRSQ